MKIGHNKAFWLLFLNCFKILNISFRPTCITGKHFTIVWADIGCIYLIWGHLGTLRVILAHLDWFKVIWDQLGSFGLPWLLESLLKILFHLNPFFYLNLTWVKLTQARGTLFHISLLFKRKRDRGLRLLSAGTKTFANWKLKNYKSDVNKTCMTYVPP